MAATFFQSMLRVQETVQLAEDQRLSLTAAGATGFLTQEAVILGDGIPFDTFDSQAYNNAEGFSRALASQFLNSFGGELGACFIELSKVIAPAGVGVPATQPTTILPLLYQFMSQNQNSAAFASPPLVNSRNLTRGTPTYGGSNVGTGILYRLNVDAYAFPLEGGYAETKNAICVADAQTGTITGQEQFTVRGQPSRDALYWFTSGFGSGATFQGQQALVGVTADTTQPLINNSSFSLATGSGGTFALSGWTQTAGVASSMSLDTVNYYRAAQIEGTTPASLSLTGSVTITQKISSNAGALALTAYLNQIAWNGSIGAWSGSFTVQIGSKSWNVSSGAAGWQTLRPTIDKNLWSQNFNTANLAVTITITVTSGTLRIDDFCWAPFVDLGGSLFWLVGGVTAFLVNDTITVADTEPSPPSKVQNWIRLMYPGYFLPSAVLPLAPVTAPTVGANSAGGACTAGAHLIYVTFVNATAESGIGPATVVIQVTAGTQTINLTAIPTGPGGTTKRGIYMTKAGGTKSSDTPYLQSYINDNATTVLAISTADAALTQQPGSLADPVN